MKIRLGNIEDIMKDPDKIRTYNTLRQAINGIRTPRQRILLIWDSNNKLLVAKGVNEALNEIVDLPEIEWREALDEIVQKALKTSSR